MDEHLNREQKLRVSAERGDFQYGFWKFIEQRLHRSIANTTYALLRNIICSSSSETSALGYLIACQAKSLVAEVLVCGESEPQRRPTDEHAATIQGLPRAPNKTDAKDIEEHLFSGDPPVCRAHVGSGSSGRPEQRGLHAAALRERQP